MTRPNWNAEVEPGAGITVLEAVLTPTINAVGIRSDDRISAGADSTSFGDLVVTLGSKPPGEWQWSGTAAAEVELVMEQSGQVQCHLLHAGRSDERHPVGDTQAALSLGLDRHTWLSVRAIVETGLAHAAEMTAADADKVADQPLRLNPQVVARRLAELTTQADTSPTAGRSAPGPEDPQWETVTSLPVSSHQRALPTIPRDRPLGPAI